MAVSIKGLSAGQLLSLREEIDQTLAGMVAELEKQLVQIQGIAPTRRTPKRAKRTNSLAGKKVPPKYRNPDNPKETWAARGMKPKWLVTALKGGKKLESFAIKK